MLIGLGKRSITEGLRAGRFIENWAIRKGFPRGTAERVRKTLSAGTAHEQQRRVRFRSQRVPTKLHHVSLCQWRRQLSASGGVATTLTAESPVHQQQVASLEAMFLGFPPHLHRENHEISPGRASKTTSLDLLCPQHSVPTVWNVLPRLLRVPAGGHGTNNLGARVVFSLATNGQAEGPESESLLATVLVICPGDT